MDFNAYLSLLGPINLKREYEILPDLHIIGCIKDSEDIYEVFFLADQENLILHWGFGYPKQSGWVCPINKEGVSPPSNSSIFDEKAAQTQFLPQSQHIFSIQFQINKAFAPKQINFVIKKENIWFNNNCSDYFLPLKEPEMPKGLPKGPLGEIIMQIIDVEMSGRPWTLMHRFDLCQNLIRRIGNRDKEGLAWLFVWMRYSAIRVLDWQRSYNTKPRELSHSQKMLTFAVTEQAASASKEGLISPMILIRGILNTFGRGGDNGQRIRDGILEIMHRHKIARRGSNMEQWHQKLHNNTTPDDIGICEALIAFNQTNDINKYWEVLTHHGISKERLASFERPITMDPNYMPYVVPDLQEFLKTLNSIHSGTDLISSIDAARPFLNKEINALLSDILSNLNNWDKISQIERVVRARSLINQNTNRGNLDQYRESLYVDIALEMYVRQLCESIIHLNIPAKHLMRELSSLMENTLITCEDEEFSIASQDWNTFVNRFSNSFENDRNHTLLIKSAADRLVRNLGNCVDSYNELIDSKAKVLGEQFNADESTIEMFTEEIIRGSSFFSLSIILKKIDSQLRDIAKLKPWQIISPIPKIQGKLISVVSLNEVAYENYKEPTIMIVKKVNGEEEIPGGVVGVISETELDALAHVCVRARNSKVLLAVCFNDEEIEKIYEMVNNPVKVTMAGGGISIQILHENVEAVEKISEEKKEIKKPLPLEKIAIGFDEFGEGKTGAKGNNCWILRRGLPEHIGVPNSISLPYGVCERVLSHEINSEKLQSFNNELEKLENIENKQEATEILNSLKNIIMILEIPLEDLSIIQEKLETIHLSREHWNQAYTAIKKVWASKFNERVYLSTLKSNISLRDISMSVLCQEVIEGDYAFVLHTKDPFTDNSHQIYGEIVIGLGETLVGAYEGRSFSFIAHKESDFFEIQNFPNKSIALRGSGFIFRSDSNSEDLPGFAGAGLFDSEIMQKPREIKVAYREEKLCIDQNFYAEIVRKLKETGIIVENIFNGVPQDIEGVISNGKIYVVQSRPQV